MSVEFHDGASQVWYPGGYEQPPRRQIVVKLSAAAFHEPKYVLYHFAHECVYLLL